MSEQDDAPPVEASAALTMAAGMFMTTNMQPADGWRGIRDALPDPARWRLIAWLATGLEPTDAMWNAGRSQLTAGEGVLDIFGAMMLAAAAEAGDA